jgi:hypothetical protein
MSRQRATDFLMTRCAAGLWRDYLMGGTESDEWVTAYVAQALAETGLNKPRHAASEAWDQLKEIGSRHEPGLGYNRLTPQDADSSSWAVRLARIIDKSDDDFALGCLNTVRSHVLAAGGVATYTAASLLKAGVGDSELAVAGWVAPHFCVSGAAAYIPEIGGGLKVCEYLVSRQEHDGRWRSYWWADDEYATALAIESLAAREGYEESVNRAALWLSKAPETFSAFVLALRIVGLRRAACSAWQQLLPSLLNLQLEDGSWPASAQLRMPPPHLVDPRRRWRWDKHSTGIGCVMVDRNRTFTTATVIRALTACLND